MEEPRPVRKPYSRLHLGITGVYVQDVGVLVPRCWGTGGWYFWGSTFVGGEGTGFASRGGAHLRSNGDSGPFLMTRPTPRSTEPRKSRDIRTGSDRELAQTERTLRLAGKVTFRRNAGVGVVLTPRNARGIERADGTLRTFGTTDGAIRVGVSRTHSRLVKSEVKEMRAIVRAEKSRERARLADTRKADDADARIRRRIALTRALDLV